MKDILLIRHAQAYANRGDFTEYNNIDSPLTERGRGQIKPLRLRLTSEYGIISSQYSNPVLASTFVRPQETARLAGFKTVHINPLIDEADVSRPLRSGQGVIAKHRKERWAPLEVLNRANRFIEQVQGGDLDYEIYFSHGLFIGAVLLQCEAQKIPVPLPFSEDRGYIPLQTGIVKLAL